jgi:predicted MFS family arabinose efflux permease
MSYLALLRRPGVARLVVGAFIGRLSTGMETLAFILLVRQTSGSFALAGGVAAADAVGAGVAATPMGRAVDRLGQTRVLGGTAGLHVVGLGALLVAARGHAIGAVLIGLGAAIGLSTPPVGGAMRTMWPRLTSSGPTLERAFALEATLQELVFIIGPLLVGAIVAGFSPSAAVVVCAAVTAAGVALFVTAPASRAQRGGQSTVGWAGALAASGMRTLVLATLPIGIALGTVEIVVPAFATSHGSGAAAGLLLGIWGVGSVVGGLWFGARRWTGPLERRYAALLAVFPLVTAALGFASSNPALGVLLFVAGMPLAPMFSVLYLLIDRLGPAGAETEAFTLVTTAIVIGAALGVGAGGTLVGPLGTGGAFAVAGAAAVIAPLIALVRRRTLEPVAA